MRPALSAKRDLNLVEDPISLATIKTSATAEVRRENGHFYRPLPTRFRHNGFDYEQIHREADLAIYRQSWNGNKHSAAFEVISIRRHDGFRIDGRFVEPAEVYPNSEAWGTDGFTVMDKDLAFIRLRKLA